MDKNTLIAALKELNIFDENEYFFNYINLIFNNLNTVKEQFKTSKHHFIPVCFYKIKYNLSTRKESEIYALKDVNNFLINLSYKDHALAHYYLALCVKDIKLQLNMLYALNHIIGLNKKLNKDNLKYFIDNLDQY